MLRNQFNLDMEIEIDSKDIGLVAAQMIFDAYSRMINGYALHLLHLLYTHISVRACGRAGVRACGRASVDKNKF